MGTVSGEAIDALFANMSKAEVFGKGSYFEKGIYEIELKVLKVNDGFNGKSFISEFEVLSSTNEKIEVGCTRSFVINFTNKYIMADVTLLVMALLGFDPSKKENLENKELRETVAKYTRAALGSETAVKELGSEYEADMFIGQKLRLECAITATKPSAKNPTGGTFTHHKWTPIEAAVA